MLLLHRDGTISLSATTSHPPDIVLAHVYFGSNLTITKLFTRIGKLITIDNYNILISLRSNNNWLTIAFLYNIICLNKIITE